MGTLEKAFHEFGDLPDDPEMAFAALYERAQSDLHVISRDNQMSGWDKERQFVNTLIAGDDVYKLGILFDYKNPPVEDADFGPFFKGFCQKVEVETIKIKMKSARRNRTGAETIIILDFESRKAIHTLIDAIREKLNEIVLPENKRDALFKKLNAFAAEVDQNRTRTEAFYAFSLDTFRAINKVGGELKPFQQAIDRVADIIDSASKMFDALPPGDDQKKIEGPAKRLSPPK